MEVARLNQTFYFRILTTSWFIFFALSLLSYFVGPYWLRPQQVNILADYSRLELILVAVALCLLGLAWLLPRIMISSWALVRLKGPVASPQKLLSIFMSYYTLCWVLLTGVSLTGLWLYTLSYQKEKLLPFVLFGSIALILN